MRFISSSPAPLLVIEAVFDEHRLHLSNFENAGTRVNTRGEQEELATLTSPDCFGEMALMDNSPRHATVIAKGEVHCLTLDRAHFVKLLGPLKSILQAHSCLHVLHSIELFSELTDAS